MQSFSELTISPYIKERLADARFTIPTPVQVAAIPEALAGKDVLATAQTGTGKTLAFLIPIMQHMLQNEAAGIAALVLVPTRELAMQAVDQYNALGGSGSGPQLSWLEAWPKRTSSPPSAKAPAWWSPLPGDWRISSDANSLIFGPCASSFSTNPTACSTWDSFPPFAGLRPYCPRIARRCAFPPRWLKRWCTSLTITCETPCGWLSAAHQALGDVRVQAFEVAHDRKQASP